MNKIYCSILFAAIINLATAQNPFIYGVASGDPLTDRVMIWTKLAPADTTQPITVNWRIADDPGFAQVVNSGSFITYSASEFTVKVDATGLQPGSWYYYEFETGGNSSIPGRTKTAPVGTVDHVRFVVATCAKYSKGYFNAYGRIAARNDIDAVIHLGDYIYESNQSNDDIRPMVPDYRCFSLSDFRTRYKQYHTDADLIAARQQFPWINVWDDHETSNDCWLYGSEHWPDSATYALVKEAATRAYFEWLPIRQDSANPWRIYRKFQYGDLLDLIMLDTRREGREQQIPFNAANAADIYDPGRTILGQEQFNWLTANLDNSSATWRIVGQQVMMAPALLGGNPINEDQWDNYPAERTKLFDHILNNQISNIIVLTGDVHASFANNLPYDISQYVDSTGAGSVGVEFITPAILSSPSNYGFLPFDLVKANDPHIQYADFVQNGYMVLDITRSKVQGDFYFVAEKEIPDTNETLAASMFTLDGTRSFFRDSATIARGNNIMLKKFKVYPNPVTGTLTVELIATNVNDLIFRFFDINGTLVLSQGISAQQGTQKINLNISPLRNGLYILQAISGSNTLGETKIVVEN